MDWHQQPSATTIMCNFHPFHSFYLFTFFFSSLLKKLLYRIALLSVVLIVMTSCQLSSAIPRLNNAMLWKRLGLNRAIGAGNRPQITSTKKKGESTVYFIKLPPQPHFYIPFNLLPSTGYQKSTPEPFETVSLHIPPLYIRHVFSLSVWNESDIPFYRN